MEKAVDHTLVRIMTQEFEGLQLLHPNRKDRPRRTVALVAGDFDYVDVVEQARLSGCDVEMWYWTGRASLSTQWIREESRRHDALGTFTFYDLREHFDFLTAKDDDYPAELPGDRPDRFSLSSERSAADGPINLGGAIGRRRFSNPNRERKQEQVPPSTPEIRRVALTESIVMPWTGGESPSPFAGSITSQASQLHSPVRGGHLLRDGRSVPRCSFREFCNQEGCKQRHTGPERCHFRLHGGRGRYRLAKTKACKGGKLCKANAKRYGVCPFLHGGEEILCVKCLQVHGAQTCEVERIRPINALEARQLVRKGYLVDLLMTKSTVGQPSSSRSTSRTSGISDGSSIKTESIPSIPSIPSTMNRGPSKAAARGQRGSLVI